MKQSVYCEPEHIPTPQQIRERCEAIQQEWTDYERWRRQVQRPSHPEFNPMTCHAYGEPK